MRIDKTFFDKKCDIYRKSVIDKDGTQIPDKVEIYNNLPCDYFIAPRGNVINYLPNDEARNTERDRFDCVISSIDYDTSKQIKKGDSIILHDSFGNIEGGYVIDQLSILIMPNGKIENIYLRLNNDTTGDLL